ncbi:MAG: hypothetical protein ACLSAC_04140 [Enterocloster bolteae]
MNQKREIRTVSLIGLGAIGCFLASHLGPLTGEIICGGDCGGSRRERLEQGRRHGRRGSATISTSQPRRKPAVRIIRI